MLAAFKRFYLQWFGNPNEEIEIEHEPVNEHNKRPLPDLCDDVNNSLAHQRKRQKRLFERNNGTCEIADHSLSNSLPSTSKPVSNGTDTFWPQNTYRIKNTTKMEQSTHHHTPSNKLREMRMEYLTKQNLSAKKRWQSLNISDMGFNRTSALSDLNKMREKLAYDTLIKSQFNILSEFNRISLRESTLIDLTKEVKKPDVLSKSEIIDLDKTPVENHEPKFELPVSCNVTLRKPLKSPTSEHTEWVQNLNKRFNQLELQRKLKISDEELRAKVLHEKNKEFDRVIEDRLLKQLHIKEVIDLEESDHEEDEIETVLPVLSESDEKRIAQAMSGNSDRKITEKFGYIMTGSCLYTLHGLNWLNDNVVNFYMTMLTKRGEEPGRLKVFAMNSFLCVNLRKRGYSSVRRWTRKVDLFSFDLVPIPVHVNGVHWCMIMVDFRKKTLKYYDSMGSENQAMLDLIEEYLKEESLDKRKSDFDLSGWTKLSVKGIPQQMNGCDCGVFSCMFAEYICRGAKINFSQKDMPYFRRKMCLEILNGKLLL